MQYAMFDSNVQYIYIYIHVEVVKPLNFGIFWYTSVLNLDNEVITYYRVTMGDVPVHHRG